MFGVYWLRFQEIKGSAALCHVLSLSKNLERNALPKVYLWVASNFEIFSFSDNKRCGRSPELVHNPLYL